MPVDERLRAATLEQLEHRRRALAAGARHVGWKLGIGDRERIGDALAVGHLTSATVLTSGGTYRAQSATADLRADVELAVALGADVAAVDDEDAVRLAVAGYATALELVDLAPHDAPAETIVATNVFHRAVVLGAVGAAQGATVVGIARVDGDLRASGEADADVSTRLLAAARVLEAAGERLRRGDVVITGSIVQVAVAPGDTVEAEVARLGRVSLAVAG